MVAIENKTFDEIEVGQSATLQRTLTEVDIRLFAVLSGDANPTHDPSADVPEHRAIGHGMWGGALISALLGNELPGAGTQYRSQTLDFLKPVWLGDTLTVTITVTGRNPADQSVTFDCRGVNQNGDAVLQGTAVVQAPTRKQSRDREAGLYAQF
jgi:phosphate acetyltransferase/phosphate butyryltransferase